MVKLKPCPICGSAALGRYRKLDPPQFAYEHCGICGGYRNDWKSARMAWNKTIGEWILKKEREKVDRHTATECAYKNGYAAGLKAAEKHAKREKIGVLHWLCHNCYEEMGGSYNYCPHCGAKLEEKRWLN